MSRTLRIVFEDFSGGERGQLPSWRSSKNLWSGRNMIPAVDGTLIPRSGLVNLAKTGMAANPLVGMGWVDGGAGNVDRGWAIVGTTLYRFDPATVGGGVAAATGTLSASATRVIHAWDEAGLVWLTNYGDRVYKYDPNANTLTAIGNTTGTAAGRCVTAWNGFLITGGGPTNPARIYWSDGDSFDVWPAAPNFEPIGSLNSAVTGLFVLRGQLVVAKDDGTWWVVTGDLPTSTFPTSVFNVRQVFQSQTPLLEPQHGALIGGQAVWLVGRSAPWPSWFNGSSMSDLEYLDTDLVPAENGGTQPNLNVTRLTGPSDLLIAGGTVGADRVLLRNDAWSRHRFGVAGLEWTAPMADGLVLMSDGGAVGEAARFFVWQATGLERPPDGGVTLQSITDDGVEVDTFVELNEWINDAGLDGLVRTVLVDFERFDQGVGAPPQQFALEVVSTRRTRDDIGTKPSITQRWSGNGRTASTDSKLFYFGDQGDGMGFVVRLTDVRGVKLERVTIEFQDEGDRS